MYYTRMAAMTENQKFITEIDITHLTNISTPLQLYTEVRKKSDVVFQKKSLGLARFEPRSSCTVTIATPTLFNPLPFAFPTPQFLVT